MIKDTLYIIGNGFDLAHNMATRYDDFRKWLIGNGRIDIIKELQSVFPEQNKNGYLLWSDFENALGFYDINKVINWNWKDLCLIEYTIGEGMFTIPDYYLNTKLLDIINNSFSEWFSSIPLPIMPKYNNLKKDAYYLTFNYTDTLETLYGISEKQILHIHGRVSKKEKLIFGHDREITISGYLNKSFDVRENNERIQRLNDIDNLRKPCDKIIENNDAFFQNLSHIQTIYPIGHSCAKIDFPYFQKIKKSIDAEAIWSFTPYNKDDKRRMQELKKMLNLDDKHTIGI